MGTETHIPANELPSPYVPNDKKIIPNMGTETIDYKSSEISSQFHWIKK